MRAAFDALERLGIPPFVTGSVAASVHGVLRQSPQARGEVRLRLAARGKPLARQQVDAMAPTSKLERAELLPRRLYPGMPERTLQQVLAQPAEAEDAGTWHGFQRPDPSSVR